VSDSISLADVARAVMAARTAGESGRAGSELGRAVAVVARADAGSGGARVLVFEDGEVRGTLGGPKLDRAAAEIGVRLLASPGESAWTLESEDGATTLYAEAHSPPARLFIVGAGHIAVPLARIGDMLGFPVIVLDDREGFATDERFPDAVRVERVDFEAPFRDLAWGPDDFAVLVTRAHRYDFDCLRSLLDGEAPPRYIGMVGSQRRVRAAFRALLEAGVDPDRLGAIHAPIGVDIGAETPEEIALSIGAELVAVRRGTRAGGSLRDEQQVVERLLRSEGSEGSEQSEGSARSTRSTRGEGE